MGAEGDSSETGAVAAEEVSVNIRCSNGSKFAVRTSLDSTVSAFKALVAQNCDVPADQQRLIYKGRILKDDQTLVSYGTSICRCRCFSSSICLDCALNSIGFWSFGGFRVEMGVLCFVDPQIFW